MCLPPEERAPFLGPFHYARSPKVHRKAEIARVIQAALVFIAEDDGEIIGVLRGRPDKLQGLFVREDYHRQGVGRRLVKQFEQACREQGEVAINREHFFLFSGSLYDGAHGCFLA